MNSVIAAVSALFFTINVQLIDVTPNLDIESELKNVVYDESCEYVATDLGIIKIEKDDLEMLAKLVWGEARGIKSIDERAAVVWCVLNRVDAGYGKNIRAVVTSPGQFTGYRRSNPVTDEFYNLALDVVTRWNLEKMGLENSGRVLPKEYLYFAGKGGRNYFRTSYRAAGRWDWSLESPYV